MMLIKRYIIPKTMDHWKDVAIQSLCYDPSMVEQIEKDCASDPEICCSELFRDWLGTDNGISPKTWRTLLTQLKQVKELADTSEKIRKDLIDKK